MSRILHVIRHISINQLIITKRDSIERTCCVLLLLLLLFLNEGHISIAIRCKTNIFPRSVHEVIKLLSCSIARRK